MTFIFGTDLAFVVTVADFFQFSDIGEDYVALLYGRETPYFDLVFYSTPSRLTPVTTTTPPSLIISGQTISSSPSQASTTKISPSPTLQPSTSSTSGIEVTHSTVSAKDIQKSSKGLQSLNCDKWQPNIFPKQCQIDSIKYKFTESDSKQLTVIAIPVKGSNDVNWGWISIPANTLTPGCVIEIKGGSTPPQTKLTKGESDCEGNKVEEDAVCVTPSISIKAYCDGKKVTSFKNSIDLQFIGNWVKNGRTPCVGFFQEQTNQKLWDCFGLQTDRINDQQQLYSGSTHHFTR